MDDIFRLTPVASIIFIFTIITSIYAFYNEQTYGKFMLHPYSVSKGSNIYQLITSGLIHKDWAHLGFNMFSYYVFAFQLEQTIGHWQFGFLYVASLILSDLPTVNKQKNNFHYHSLGASGAVCAIVFSFILFSPATKLYVFLIPFPIPAIVYGLLFLVYTSYAGRKANDGINHDAHFYGAIAGIIITIVLIPKVIQIFLEQIQVNFL